MTTLHEQTAARKRKLDEAVADLSLDQFDVTTGNRTTAKRLLNGLGWPSDLYESASLGNLHSFLNAPVHHASYLDEKGMSERDIQGSLARFSTALRDIKQVTPTSQKLLAMFSEKINEKTIPHISAPSPFIEPETPKEETKRIKKRENPEAQTEVEKKLAALMDVLGGTNELDEDRVRQIAAEEAARVPATRISLVTEDGERELPEGLRHELFGDVVQCVNAGLHVMLVGPAGSGKTTLAEQVAEALDLPFRFNGAIASEYKLNGFMNAQGQYVGTAFREAFAKGGLYLFDEVDASMPQALLAFNAALANGCADFPDGNIKMHKNFRCMAAANTFGRGADRTYVGRNQLDGASLDRFAVMDFDYDEKLERALAGNDIWVERVQSIRNAVQSAQVRHVVSPRASMNGARLLGAGMRQDRVEELVIWKGLDKETRNRVQSAIAA